MGGGLMGPVSIQIPTPDWGSIIPTIVPLFFSAIGTYLMQLTQRIMGEVNGSGVNILTRTPPEWTYRLGPLHDLSASGADGLYGVISLAIVLAGFALLGRQFFGWGWTLGEHAARIALACLLTTGCLRMVAWSIDLENSIAGGIGSAPIPSPGDLGSVDPLVGAIVAIVWIVLLARLLIRMAYRLLMIDLLILIGPLAMLTWAVPQSQWVARRWISLWVTWLGGQILVVAILKLGSLLANPFGGSWAGMILGIGVLLIATDATRLLGVPLQSGSLMGPIFLARSVALGTVALATGGGAIAAATPRPPAPES
jgi:hypothetical protein